MSKKKQERTAFKLISAELWGKKYLAQIVSNFDELSVDKYKTTEVRNKKLAGSNCYLEIEPLNWSIFGCTNLFLSWLITNGFICFI